MLCLCQTNVDRTLTMARQRDEERERGTESERGRET